MPKLEDVFNQKEIIDYFKEKPQSPMLGDGLFTPRKIQDIEFDMILGSNEKPVTAECYAFDTPTKIASRNAIQKGVQALALIKRKTQITEKELIKINTPRTQAELTQAVSKLYNDAENVRTGVYVRAEAMRMELISTGKIKIEENGVKVEIDYDIPAGNQMAFNWKASTAKPLDDLVTLADAVEDECGIRPTRALTSRKVARAICNNASVRKAVLGVNSDKIVTLAALNELLVQMDLPQIATYDEKYRKETSTGYTTERYFPEDKISMFGDGELGETIWGLTAEEVDLIGAGKMETAEMIGEVFVGTYKDVDPVAHYTKASATCLPTLPHGEEVGIATITLD